jgi:hypothetical protein
MKRTTRFALGIALGAGAVVMAAPMLRAQAAPVAEKERVKNVSGTVLDKGDKPLGGAVVYLKNTKTLAVKSFISQDNGEFRFNALSPNVDYEVYAEFNGARSSTKSVSSFDSKTNVTMTLKVDTGK